MAYMKNNLIVRPVGLAGLWDDLKGIASGALNIYGQQKANEAIANQQVATQPVPVMPTSSGISTGTILTIGAVGIGAILLLRKRKKS